MVAIYRTAWQCVLRNLALYLLGAALFIAVDAYNLASDSRGAGSFVAWFAVVYGLHRAILLGEDWRGGASRPNVPQQGLGAFLFVALMLVGLALIAPVGLFLWVLSNVEVPQDAFAGLVLLLLLIFVVVYALVLAVFGTALPASAVRDRFGLRLTLSRGRRTGWGVLGGLIVGPGLFWVATAAGQIGLARLVGPVPAFHEDGVGFNLAALAWKVPHELLTLFNATLTVAVLCRAYRKVAPPEVTLLLQPEAMPLRSAMSTSA